MVRKNKYTCQGGPFAGAELVLSVDYPVSIVFSIGKDKGCYACKTEYGSYKGKVVEWRAV